MSLIKTPLQEQMKDIQDVQMEAYKTHQLLETESSQMPA